MNEDRPKPWYQNGLRFECTRCGNCCRNHGAYTYVYVSDREVAVIAAHLGLERRQFLERYCFQEDGWTALRMDAPACPFLTADNRCSIYSVRPKQCATWPFWKENLVESEWNGPVKECCPGIGAGGLVDYHKIEQQASETETELQ